jgi:oligopeptide/dipeptide ABC transporter ATP-binding protein
MDADMTADLLRVDDLRVTLTLDKTRITPVDGVSFTLATGEALGVVGESGSGKSLSLRAILGLVPPNAEVGGSIAFALKGQRPNSGPQDVCGRGAAMIFQEPMTALNPTMRVGDLIAEGVRSRRSVSRADAQARALELLNLAGVPDAKRRARMWPHELSGGLRQRVMIAAALSTDPELLLCDEPTTALDVTVQDQILGLLATLRRELGMALIFVSHDLAVVSEVCDRIVVMYAGQIVESGPTDAVIHHPRHPYTAALLAAVPSLTGTAKLQGIGGRPPDPRNFPPGCRFAPRCAFAQDDCRATEYQLLPLADRATACIHADLLTGATT